MTGSRNEPTYRLVTVPNGDAYLFCESSSLRDCSLEEILSNATDLEYFSSSRCRGLASRSLRHIHRLQRLRSLGMPDTGTYTGGEEW